MKKQRCGWCRKPGHNVRTCQHKAGYTAGRKDTQPNRARNEAIGVLAGFFTGGLAAGYLILKNAARQQAREEQERENARRRRLSQERERSEFLMGMFLH